LGRVGGFGVDAAVVAAVDAIPAVRASTHDPCDLNDVLGGLIYADDDASAGIRVPLQQFEIGARFFDRIHALPAFLFV